MMIETELKLLIKSDEIPQLIAHPILQQDTKIAPVREDLLSYYFDSSELILFQHGFALRIREIDGCLIQTIKRNDVQSYDGLYQRQEWQVEVPSLVPDLSIIPDLKLRQQLLTQPPQYNIDTIFTTEFNRTTWQLFLAGDVHIELALDIGKVCAGNHCAPIQEIEFELKHGNVEALFQIRDELSKTISLEPSAQSKAEMGYRLVTLLQEQPH